MMVLGSFGLAGCLTVLYGKTFAHDTALGEWADDAPLNLGLFWWAALLTLLLASGLRVFRPPR